jgi:hypothetical protein
MGLKMFTRRKKHRPVFGFPCTPSIANDIRALATILKLPYYCIAEHGLQIAASMMITQLQDPDAARQLEEHLIESHLLVNVVEEGNAYDQAAMEEAQKKQLAKQAREQTIRRLVSAVENEGLPADAIIQATKLLIETVRSRRRQQNR